MVNNVLREIWLFMPAKIKEKSYLLLLICILILAFCALLGYLKGVTYGINHANAFWINKTASCLCPIGY